MNIFDFITQDELDELPEHESDAFVEFVRHAQRRFDAKADKLDGQEEHSWHRLQDLRHSFMNVVMAAAKKYDIAPFAKQDMPFVEGFKSEEYEQFKADLDHYITQMILDTSSRNKRDGISLTPTIKDKIRTYVHGLKEAIDKSDFTDARKAALLDKIAAFEKELDKRRLSLLAVTRLTIYVLSVPGNMWASADIANRLTTNILQTVGEAKAADDEKRALPPHEAPKALMPPRAARTETARTRAGRKTTEEAPAAFQRDEMDDEIPF